jgi:hypothetical protein
MNLSTLVRMITDEFMLDDEGEQLGKVLRKVASCIDSDSRFKPTATQQKQIKELKDYSNRLRMMR